MPAPPPLPAVLGDPNKALPGGVPPEIRAKLLAKKFLGGPSLLAGGPAGIPANAPPAAPPLKLGPANAQEAIAAMSEEEKKVALKALLEEFAIKEQMAGDPNAMVMDPNMMAMDPNAPVMDPNAPR